MQKNTARPLAMASRSWELWRGFCRTRRISPPLAA